MKAWQIFVHSWRQVFGNFGAALQVSVIPYLIGQAALFGSGLHNYPTAEALQAAMDSGQLNPGLAFAVGVVSGVMSLWIAVAWHRFVLTEERGGVVPVFHADRVLGYFGKGLGIGLMIVIPALLLLMLGAVVGHALFRVDPSTLATSPGKFLLAQLVPLIFLLPVGVLMTRLSAMLPGAALKPGVPILSGWEATKGESGVMLGVVGLTFGLALILQVPLFFIQNSFLVFVWGTITGWISLMLGASVLTTLYGHYIEKRALV
ncbi:hypothetical protein [Neogemmobacter tilapiae]|uniref:Uncharacterized protein n=1 Tax=Neogemmobacter tilapiae TaxID=875041 RepID=A0A918WIW7_9RHOB|nr:hypothetical protein [Gemmobacter tilapiae]GHC50581.1 hypothetical protein GCM10007315_11150 [Gemmobacter tilapiae]